MPPYSSEAEAGVLGCILLDAPAALPECVTRFGKAGASVFYDNRHAAIYGACNACAEAHGGLVDLVLLRQRLTDCGQLEEVGGLEYLMGLQDATPSAANVAMYAQVVWEKWLLRRAIQACSEAIRRMYSEGSRPVGELLDQMEQEVLAVNQERASGGAEARGMLELMQRTNELIDTLHRGVGIVGGIRTRFGYLDKVTGGLHRKELSVLAARPSLGKTSLALNMALNAAKLEGTAAGVFSLEMSAEDLVLRMRCAEAGVDFHKLRTGFPAKEDLQRLGDGMIKMSGLPLWIDDTPALGILELRARARRLARRHRCELFVVDYLQLMHGLPKDYRGSREREVADISAGLKSMAKELNAAVLVCSQLNREMERNKNRKPQLADLRESGAIEQDADLVMMLYRPKSDQEEEDGPTQRVNALVAKQRNGPTGDVELIFRRSLMRFEDAYFNTGHR